jgi:hypothetical protein
MNEDHLVCPKCGYDLHGIPEVRCPECGFRYDAAALRSITPSVAWIRLGAARGLIIYATAAAALATPAVCDRLGVANWARFLVVAAAYGAAFLTWMILTGAYRGPASVPGLTGIAAIAVVLGCTSCVSQVLALACCFAVLLPAWFIRLRQ